MPCFPGAMSTSSSAASVSLLVRGQDGSEGRRQVCVQLREQQAQTTGKVRETGHWRKWINSFATKVGALIEVNFWVPPENTGPICGHNMRVSFF